MRFNFENNSQPNAFASLASTAQAPTFGGFGQMSQQQQQQPTFGSLAQQTPAQPQQSLFSSFNSNFNKFC
jgi:hypothetical protein